MKPKTMILMAVAVTCGLGASYMTSRLLAERGKEAPDTKKVQVLVAAKNLEIGQSLKNPDQLFTFKEFLEGTEPKDRVLKIEDIKNRSLKRALQQGVPLCQDDLLDGSGMHATIPSGFRAMGLRVNMESIAGGFASLPLSRVDIIATIRRGSDKDSFTKVLLENVLVLAADTQMHRDAEGRAMPANVVTVAVKPEDVLKVSMARELGPLSLVLRKFHDNTKSGDLKFTAEQLVTNQGVAAQPSGDDTEPTSPIPLPPIGTETAPAPKVEAREPEGRIHVLKVYDGDRERHVKYLLNKDGEVIPSEVTRSELTPPRPPQPQVDQPPPRPEPQAPETPPKKNED